MFPPECSISLASQTMKPMLEQGQAEHKEMEDSDRIKSEFLSLLNHEFRTPLQAIVGYTELLEREIHGPLTAAQRHDLMRIQESQQHLLGLVTTFLEVARETRSAHGPE